MVVVVHVPHAQGGGALVFAGPGAGVEEFLGQDPVIALDFAVVARCRLTVCTEVVVLKAGTLSTWRDWQTPTLS
jgi:hypothetical protein